MLLIFIVETFFLLGSIGFIWGLRLLSSPDTARKGNIYAGVGMTLAIIASLIMPFEGEKVHNNYAWVIIALLIGTVIGYIAAVKVAMTSMPQMVSVFNGLGGACAVVLGLTDVLHYYDGTKVVDTLGFLTVLLTLLIGGVAFTGSIFAYAKLEDLVDDKKVTLPKHSIINLLMLLVLILLGIYILIQGEAIGMEAAIIFLIISLIYGVSFVAPIGGADMPVVISLLNSFSGLSGAAAGILFDSQFMVVGGILVGASGTILTVMMCNAMNRSIWNVLIGGFGGSTAGSSNATGGNIKEITLNDAAIQLYYAQSVIIVPGYGLAVAQAQKICKEIDDQLSANGVDVKYAIHPVAGRMPGHMNVLLAEADVPYPKLLDLDEANSSLSSADVAIIIGANDVVNPAAENDPGSPIYGMPVLKVWHAKSVIVMKRSMRSGYAGIENPLFFHERTKMLFGDAKDVLGKLNSEIKAL
jgi:NAD(P) transhydrogenase subunit beta